VGCGQGLALGYPAQAFYRVIMPSLFKGGFFVGSAHGSCGLAQNKTPP